MTLKTIRITHKHICGLEYENCCNLILIHNTFLLKLIRNVTKHFNQKYDYCLYTNVKPYLIQPQYL